MPAAGGVEPSNHLVFLVGDGQLCVTEEINGARHAVIKTAPAEHANVSCKSQDTIKK